MSNERHYESMLFNYETTNRTDYRDGEIKPIFRTEYKEKPRPYRTKYTPLKDIHTLTDWKSPNVPFDLYFKRKEIVGTDPRDVQRRHEKPLDFGLEHAVKTRPRLVMTPAVSMDDITSPETRKILIEDVYITSAQKAMRESVVLTSKTRVVAPFSGTPASANPITLKKLVPPYVSPEWRMESAAWDNRQLRAYCDPSREFYLGKIPRTAASDGTSPVEARERLEKQT